MSFEVKFRLEAEKDLEQIANQDKVVAQRILSKIKWIATNCAFIRHETLSGELSAFYKRRVGDYRVIYLVNANDNSVEICMIGHRKDIYTI